MTQNHYSFGKKINITDDIYIYIYIYKFCMLKIIGFLSDVGHLVKLLSNH